MEINEKGRAYYLEELKKEVPLYLPKMTESIKEILSANKVNTLQENILSILFANATSQVIELNTIADIMVKLDDFNSRLKRIEDYLREGMQ